MIYSFDNHTVDVAAHLLRRGDVPVPLTPKVFQTLLVLIENRDHIMTKDELLSAIWPETIVEESNLTQNVSVLRRALGETTHRTNYIGTFPGRGYRFLEPVRMDRENGSSENGSRSGFLSEEFLPREDLPPRAELAGSSLQPGGRSPSPEQAKPVVPSYRRYIAVVLICLALTAVGVLTIMRRKNGIQKEQSLPGQSMEVRTLSRMVGAQYQPSWSRDGKHLAFVYSDPNDSGSAIYIQSTGELQPHRVAYGAGEYSSPVWSPDGKLLAYVHMQPNTAEIVILNIARSTSRRLATLFPRDYGLNCRHLDWSPDGTVLVVDDKSVENDPLSLYLVYVSNGSKIRLTYPTFDIIGDASPRFSPDGAQVAFIRMKYQYQFDAFVLPVTGGMARRLTDRSSLLGDVGWDTNHSLIFSGRRDGAFRLWRQDLRSAQLHAVLASSLETDTPLQFSILPRSRQIVFSAYRPNLDIWALNLSKKPFSGLDWTPVVRTPGQDIAPSYSPDGTRISFRSDVSGKMQLWISKPDGSGAYALHTGDLVPSTECWAPDGKSIVFSSTSTHGVYQVALSQPGRARRITGDLSHPYYSVDGRWIFARIRNVIYRIPAGGGPLQQVTDQGGAPITQSKDGRYLYFGHGRMDTTISRLDLSTKHQEVIIHSLVPAYRDAWALTSQGIVFLTEQSGQLWIVFHEFATGKERRIAEFVGPLPPIGTTSGFSISPDERRLLVVRAEPASANIQTMMLPRVEKN